MHFSSIPRTSTFTFSPSSILTPFSTTSSTLPLIATGTVAGALDESFSNESWLEIWSPFEKRRKDDVTSSNIGGGGGEEDAFADVGDAGMVRGKVPTGAKFNRLAWGPHPSSSSNPTGLIASGMESGQLSVWDVDKILSAGSAGYLHDASTTANDDEGAAGGESGGAKHPCLLFENKQHTGPVRGLDFNKLKSNLLGSGGINGEIYIWDLLHPVKPYSPGSRNRSLDDITTLAWNKQVSHILATGSNSGYTVVWDSKNNKEAVPPLIYNPAAAGGQAGWMGGNQPGYGGMGIGGRGGISQLEWCPDNPTRLVTASEDDMMPVIMIWDLRNSRAPEKVLKGHEKGVLSLSWCDWDPELLLSTGKDCRTLCWNTTTGDIVAELPPSNNWSFQVSWCPRNPDLLAVGSFDGNIDIHSLQSTNVESDDRQDVGQAATGGAAADIFDSAIQANKSHAPVMSLKQTPKWLKRPTSIGMGFGGKVVSVGTRKDANGTSTSHVTLHNVVTEGDIVRRAVTLEAASSEGQGGLRGFCEEKLKGLAKTPEEQQQKKGKDEKADWKLLGSLFQADSRDELVTLLGFSKEEIKSKVEDAIKIFKDRAVASGQQTPSIPHISKLAKSASYGAASTSSGDSSAEIPREPLVTFAEPDGSNNRSGSDEGEMAGTSATSNSLFAEGASSEASVSGVSEFTKPFVSETEVTEPSLFGDDPPAGGTATGLALGNPQQSQATNDFYNSIRSGRAPALPDHVFRDRGEVTSVAATAGSRPSSIASDSMLKQQTFKIYPSEESEADRLITRALVLGDFDSAVSLCLSSERFADAILLAVRGGGDLLAKTQKAYFEKRTTSLPYLRLFQSIVTDDLTDVVQNADLNEWQEIFVVLCTFAKSHEFSKLAKELGQRLEYQCSLTRGSTNEGEKARSFQLRQNAMLCYLAAGRMEKAVGIWLEELQEEEQALKGVALSTREPVSDFTIHAKALQTFIEKVTVFQSAVGYEDMDLTQTTESAVAAEQGVRTYKLADLYDRYIEYAELLATQGLATVGLKYLSLTPNDYCGTHPEDSKAAAARARLLKASGKQASVPLGLQVGAPPAAAIDPQQATGYSQPSAYGTNTYQRSAAPSMPVAQQYGTAPAPATTSSYPPASYSNTNYAPDPYAPSNPITNQKPKGYDYSNPVSNPYQPPQSSYGQPQQTSQPGGSNFLPAPPAPMGTSPTQPDYSLPQGQSQSQVPPPPKRDQQGWNDAPNLSAMKRAGSAAGHKPSAIMSPFPNAGPPGPMSPPQQPGQPGPYGGYPGGPPPPPHAGGVPPPPRAGTGTPSRMGPGPPPPPPIGPNRQGAPQQGPGPSAMSPPPGQPGPYGGPPSRPQGMSPPPTGPYAPQGGRGSVPPPPNMAQMGRGPPGPPQSGPGPYGSAGSRATPTPPPNQYAPLSNGNEFALQGPPGQQQRPPYGGPPPPGPGQQGFPNGAPPAGGPGGPNGPPRPSSRPGVPIYPPGHPMAGRPVQPGGPGAPPMPGSRGTPPPPQGAGPAGARASPKPETPKTKYPPGDRSHIPDEARPVFGVLSAGVGRLRQVMPPNQKRMVDDAERRLNSLFDLLNCETLSNQTLGRLLEIIKAIENRDTSRALQLHLELLTAGPPSSDEVSSWQAGVKLIIQRAM